ncbi:MAG: hypothetical protein NTX74_06170 [Flavobacterium sp.]|nr:hypothetical protein [Flavobacterium sp.]
MKTLIKIFSALIIFILIVSCEKGDLVTGSPEDSDITKVQLTGLINTPDTEVVAGQPFPLSITLPRSFDINVSVEATSFIPNTGKRYRGTVIIPAGQSTITFQMRAPGSDISDMPFKTKMEVFLSAITTDPIREVIGFEGVQYSLNSNKLELDFGDSKLSSPNSSILSINIDSEGPHWNPNIGAIYNALNYRVVKNGVYQNTIPAKATTGSSLNPVYNSFYGKSNVADKVELNILNVAENGSSTDGEYIIKLYPTKLVSSQMDLFARFTIRFPDDKAKTISLLLPGLVANTLINATTGVQVLKIVKTTSDEGMPLYDIIVL